METNSSKTLSSVTCSLSKEPEPKIIFLEDKKELPNHQCNKPPLKLAMQLRMHKLFTRKRKAYDT